MNFISEMMGGLYWAISQVLLFWHGLWDKILPDRPILGTTWQWILSIVFLVITIRVVLFPIFVKQIKSQRAMQVLQPKMKELQDKHKGDRETMQRELMELYRKEKVNPLMGCLPMFLQIPVFLSLFHVLRWIDGKDKRMLYGWTKPLFDSAAEARLFEAPIPAKFSSTAAELVRLDGNATTVKIVAVVLVFFMITTTFLSSRQMILKTGWSEDPQQKMIQRIMLYGIPVSLLFSGGIFPIGVIIYWVTNNLISLGQQAWVLHKFPPPVNATAARSGGSKSADPKANGKSNTSKTGTTPVTSAKSLAPKPGAKPVRPRKGSAAKRPLS
jgi:YidC/Oxa1 family membrane protein insertase